MTSSIITLTTDFGTRDGYVGAMKGRILSIYPEAQILDLTHDLPPQDLHTTKSVLSQPWPQKPGLVIWLGRITEFSAEFWKLILLHKSSGLRKKAPAGKSTPASTDCISFRLSEHSLPKQEKSKHWANHLKRGFDWKRKRLCRFRKVGAERSWDSTILEMH